MALISINFASCVVFFSFSIFFTAQSANLPCVSKNFGKSSTVCVCNATYCDTVEPLGEIPEGQYYHMVTSKGGQRFETTTRPIKFQNVQEQQEGQDERSGSGIHAVDRSELWIERRLKFQKMIGFGGAFTDAGGINMLTLPNALQDKIYDAYFGKNGLEYNIGRIPIGGADFSDRAYTLDDLEDEDAVDPDLTKFSLQPDDHNYKIPFIKKAQLIQPNLKLFASPWSAPVWMKTNKKFTGFGRLLPEYYQSWANYFKKFMEEYDANGIQLWAITPQNEPTHGLLIAGEWNSMGWTPAQQRDFLKNNLGPTIRNSKYNATKIIMMDDQRFSVVEWSRTILGDPESAQYVDGIGLHWYANPYTPPFPLNVAHNEFPDYFMINTEACTGYLHFIPGIDPVIMGSWERAQLYAHNIIEDLNHWLTGWVEWNLILDMNGGPNWAGNQVDAPIIVSANGAASEAYKQPMFYALGHFTKFLTENSVRISNSGKEMRSLEVLSVLRPDNKIVVIVYNSADRTIPLTIRDSMQEGSIEIDIGPHSINTIVYTAEHVEDNGSTTDNTNDNTTDNTNDNTTGNTNDNTTGNTNDNTTGNTNDNTTGNTTGNGSLEQHIAPLVLSFLALFAYFY